MNNTHNLNNYSIPPSPILFSFGPDSAINTFKDETFLNKSNNFISTDDVPFSEVFEKTSSIHSLQKTTPYTKDDSDINFEHNNYSINLVRSFMNYNSPGQIFEEVIRSQKKLEKDEAYYISSSNNNPQMFIIPDSVLVTAEKVGVGTQSLVFKTSYISYPNTKMSTRIIKIAKTSYLTEFELLRRNLNADALNSPYIDHIQACYSLVNKKNMHLAIFEPSDADLLHADYNKVAAPTTFLVTQLKQIIEGIKILHESNLVHRDIKGENCLINYNGVGKITDTGAAQLINLGQKIHHTFYTPLYAPPFIWNTFNDQHQSRGYQGKDADVFSTGITIQYDGILPLLNYYATTRLVENSQTFESFTFLQNKILDARQEVELTSFEQLTTLGEKYPGRVSLARKIGLIFPDRDQLFEDTYLAIQLFAHHLSTLESNRLKRLANLAYKLINYNSWEVPSINFVKNELESISTLSIEQNNAVTNDDENNSIPLDIFLYTLRTPPSAQKENQLTSSPKKRKLNSLKKTSQENQQIKNETKAHYSPEKAENY